MKEWRGHGIWALVNFVSISEDILEILKSRAAAWPGECQRPPRPSTKKLERPQRPSPAEQGVSTALPKVARSIQLISANAGRTPLH